METYKTPYEQTLERINSKIIEVEEKQKEYVFLTQAVFNLETYFSNLSTFDILLWTQAPISDKTFLSQCSSYTFSIQESLPYYSLFVNGNYYIKSTNLRNVKILAQLIADSVRIGNDVFVKSFYNTMKEKLTQEIQWRIDSGANHEIHISEDDQFRIVRKNDDYFLIHDMMKNNGKIENLAVSKNIEDLKLIARDIVFNEGDKTKSEKWRELNNIKEYFAFFITYTKEWIVTEKDPNIQIVTGADTIAHIAIEDTLDTTLISGKKYLFSIGVDNSFDVGAIITDLFDTSKEYRILQRDSNQFIIEELATKQTSNYLITHMPSFFTLKEPRRYAFRIS